MAKVDTRLELDDALLRTVDFVAEQLGRTREEVLEDSVRRGLAARRLGDVLAGVRARSDLDEEQATRVAYEELRAARIRRTVPPDPSHTRDDSPL